MTDENTEGQVLSVDIESDAAERTDAASSTDEFGADELQTDEVTWGELGCPRKDGLYRRGAHDVRVRRIHVIVAEDDPEARFTLLVRHPPHGPTEYVLGHRIA